MNLKDIKALAAAGKIRGYKVQEGPKRADLPGQRAKTLQRDPGHKERLKTALQQFCQDKGVPLFEEQRFHEARKWRLDFLIPGSFIGFVPGSIYGPIGIEYEGLGYGKTGHTESHRYTDNTSKYNAAAAAGIIILRYTFANWQDSTEDLKLFIK